MTARRMWGRRGNPLLSKTAGEAQARGLAELSAWGPGQELSDFPALTASLTFPHLHGACRISLAWGVGGRGSSSQKDKTAQGAKGSGRGSRTGSGKTKGPGPP